MTDDEENWWFDLGYKDYFDGIPLEYPPGGPMADLARDPWQTGWKMAQREQRAVAYLLTATGIVSAIGLLLWYTRG